jgi:hypothetical protein
VAENRLRHIYDQNASLFAFNFAVLTHTFSKEQKALSGSRAKF